MKLLSKTSIYYFLFALPLFAICSLFIYYFISGEIKDNLDESLWKEKSEITEKLTSGVSIEDLKDDEITIEKNAFNSVDSSNLFRDTSIYNQSEAEILPYRVLKSNVTIPNIGSFKISVQRSYVETDDVIFSVLVPVILLFLFLFAGIFFINLFISKKIWGPFHDTIEKLKSFKLDTTQTIQFEKLTIKEFNDLNNSLNMMISKAKMDYIKQKEFTENASHEIQTPLAIIQNKIELLIQSKNLGAEEMEIITAIYQSTNRLSHLNKTLLLLTKIENHQFTENQNLDLKEVILKNLNNFSDLAETRQIAITLELENGIHLEMNPILCDSLISNLILNAIRHNLNNGKLKIELTKQQLIISNTGEALQISSEEVFQRFKKSLTSNESTGLGLSIVESICKQYDISIHHGFNAGEHQFILKW